MAACCDYAREILEVQPPERMRWAIKHVRTAMVWQSALRTLRDQLTAERDAHVATLERAELAEAQLDRIRLVVDRATRQDTAGVLETPTTAGRSVELPELCDRIDSLRVRAQVATQTERALADACRGYRAADATHGAARCAYDELGVAGAHVGRLAPSYLDEARQEVWAALAAYDATRAEWG